MVRFFFLIKAPQCLSPSFTFSPLCLDVIFNCIYSNEDWFSYELLNCFKAVNLWLKMVCYETQNKAIFYLVYIFFMFFFLLLITSINLLKYHWFPGNDEIYIYFKYQSKLSGLKSWCNTPVIKTEYFEGFYIQYWFLHEGEHKSMVYKIPW